MEEFNFSVLGHHGVGKTSLLNRFTVGHFSDAYDAAEENNYSKKLDVDGVDALVALGESVGSIEGDAMRNLLFTFGNAIIVVYAVDDRRSFEEINHYAESIREIVQDPAVPLLVVGNKADLQIERQVTSLEALRLATDLNALYLEISAKTGHMVDEVIASLVREVRRTRTKFEPSPKRSCCIQ